MLSSVTSTNPIHAPAQPAEPTQRSAASDDSARFAPIQADTVQLSSAAQAALAAQKEFNEAPGQTAQEAAGGDRQAMRLLARETAAH